MIQKIRQLSLQFSNQQIVPLSTLYENKYPLYIDIPTQKLFRGVNVIVNHWDYQKLYDIIKWRLQMENQFPIVKLNAFQIKSQNRDGLSVILFFQHTSQILESFQNLTIQQILYLIKTLLTAMEKLIDKFGFFKLTSKMIIITKSHNVKLWVNQNFEENAKMIPRFCQEQMIKQLFDIVQKHSERSELTVQLFKQAENRSQTFIRAQNFLQQFAFQHKIIVPPLFFPEKLHKRRQSFNGTNQNVNLNLSMSLSLQGDFRKRTGSSLSFYKNLANEQSQKKEFFDFKKSPQMKQKSRRWKIKNSTQLQSKKILISQKLMSKSKQMTMAQSTQINNKQNKKSLLSSNQSYFDKYNPTTSIMKFQSTSTSHKQPQKDQNKKLTMMSTLNLKTSTNTFSKQTNMDKTTRFLQDFEVKPNKSIGRKHSMSPSRHKSLNPANQQEIDCIIDIQAKYKSNKWVRKISQLFTSQKDLHQSIKDGDDEIAYLDDIKLNKLQKFGRFVSSSLLELQQKEQQQEQNSIQKQHNYDRKNTYLIN